MFIDSIPKDALVADIGCGNGKYFGVRRDVAVLGSDRSCGLAEVAAKRLHPTGDFTNCLELGFSSGGCASVIKCLSD